jgi:hypothetical protein
MEDLLNRFTFFRNLKVTPDNTVDSKPLHFDSDIDSDAEENSKFFDELSDS